MVNRNWLHSLKALLPFVVLLVFTSACMHKSVEKDKADDIIKAFIYNGSEGTFLVVHEIIFQAVSKSSGKGGTFISGYEETRLSSYNVVSGQLSARQVFGKRKKIPVCLLGWAEGNIWLYSPDNELGLHSRDPQTLAVKIKHQDIVQKNPHFKHTMAQPEWYRLTRFFGFEEIKRQLIITDNQGYRYYIDPFSLKAQKLSSKYQMPISDSKDPFSTSLDFNDKPLRVQGQLRKTFKYNSKPLNPGLSFLDGKLLKDQNKSRIYSQIQAKYLQFKKESDGLEKKLESLNQRSNRGRNLSPDEYRGYQELRNRTNIKKRSMEKYRRLYKELNEENRFYGTNLLMQPDPNSFLVIHRSNVQKDARLIISKLQLKVENDLNELWRSTHEDLFYDYNSAGDTSAFKVVFSKGNPRFDFQFFDYSEDKLLIIYMLHACCLDLESGQVLWKFRI